MKYIITAFFTFLAFNLPVFAQNWSPFNGTDHYAYRLHDSDDIISNIFGIDSVSVDNGDSTYYFNRVLSYCDTCPPQLPFYCDVFKRDFGFVQRTMQKLPNGKYKFSGEQDFTINTLGSIDETWLFSESDSITAKIVSISQTQVLSEIDSVKTIELSNGKTISISKNYGIVKFPRFFSDQYYLLAGIKDRGLGTWLPTYKDIYNYEIGDVLQYVKREVTWAAWAGSYPDNISYIRYTIIGKQTYPDSITFQVARKSKIIYGDIYLEDKEYEIITDTLNWSVTELSVGIGTPGDLLQNGHTLLRPIADVEIFYLPGITRSSFTLDSLGSPKFTSKYDNDCQYYSSFYTDDYVYAGGNPYNEMKSRSNAMYYNNVGLVKLNYSYEQYHYTNGKIVTLIGHIIDNENSGIVYPDSFYKAPTPLDTANFVDTVNFVDSVDFVDTVNFVDSTFSFNFPNPTTGVLYFNFANFRKEVLEVTVINVLGQLILTQTINKEGASAEVDLSALPWGYYFINIRGQDFRDMTKILKIE